MVMQLFRNHFYKHFKILHSLSKLVSNNEIQRVRLEFCFNERLVTEAIYLCRMIMKRIVRKKLQLQSFLEIKFYW